MIEENMTLTRFFLLGFIAAIAATAILAVYVILLGTWNSVDIKILLTTASIGTYSLIALSSSTVYGHPSWRPLAVIGIAVCAIGLTFAILTNWEFVKPTPGAFLDIVQWRLALLSWAMSLAATALMLRIDSTAAAVLVSRVITIFLIWATTVTANFLIFSRPLHLTNYSDMIKSMAVCSILGLLGIIITPILKKVTA
jgi:hypothetical protein